MEQTFVKQHMKELDSTIATINRYDKPKYIALIGMVLLLIIEIISIVQGFDIAYAVSKASFWIAFGFFVYNAYQQHYWEGHLKGEMEGSVFALEHVNKVLEKRVNKVAEMNKKPKVEIIKTNE